jgi:hypothetical protein
MWNELHLVGGGCESPALFTAGVSRNAKNVMRNCQKWFFVPLCWALCAGLAVARTYSTRPTHNTPQHRRSNGRHLQPKKKKAAVRARLSPQVRAPHGRSSHAPPAAYAPNRVGSWNAAGRKYSSTSHLLPHGIATADAHRPDISSLDNHENASDQKLRNGTLRPGENDRGRQYPRSRQPSLRYGSVGKRFDRSRTMYERRGQGRR